LPDHSSGDVPNGRSDSRGRPQIPADVLEGVRRREPEALGRFFDLAFPYVYRLAFRLLGNRESAEDLTQDVFLKVHRAADTLQTNRDPMPWLTTITYNAVRDAGRRSSARPEVDPGENFPDAPAPGETPDEALLQKERERALEKALRELDEPSRTVIILHDYCGMSHEEVATTLQVRADGVRKRYSRGLQKLARIIGSNEL